MFFMTPYATQGCTHGRCLKHMLCGTIEGWCMTPRGAMVVLIKALDRCAATLCPDVCHNVEPINARHAVARARKWTIMQHNERLMPRRVGPAFGTVWTIVSTLAILIGGSVGDRIAVYFYPPQPPAVFHPLVDDPGWNFL